MARDVRSCRFVAVSENPGAARRRWLRTAALALVIAVFPLVLFSRWRLRETPLERDEGEYAYAGQLILEGIPPYSLACNMKLPGTYTAYAGIMAVFGESISGIRMGLLLVNAGTTWLIFLLGRRLFSRNAGLAAAAVYALLSLGVPVMGQAAHATQFVVLPAAGGLLLLLRAGETGRKNALIWSGVLFGIGYLMKQHGIFFALFGAAWLLWKHAGGWPNTLRRLLLFAAAAAMPFAITCLILWRAGVFPKFWFWTFHYARAYAAENTLSDGVGNLMEEIPSLLDGTWSLWALSIAGLIVAWWKGPGKEPARFLGMLLLFSALAVCPGLYFRDHYFVLMLPAVALAAGSLAASLPASGLAWCAGCLAIGIIMQNGYLFRWSPFRVAREIYSLNAFPEAIPVSQYIRAHSSPGSRVIVLGSEPEIYFYSHRHSATGYIYTFALGEDQPFARQMRDEMIHDVESGRPEYVVLVDSLAIWADRNNGKPTVYSWWGDWGPQHYDIVGIADVISDRRTEYRWGPAAASYRPLSDYILTIYHRK